MVTPKEIFAWFDNARKVNTAVRIAIVPPWEIADVEGHYAVNVGTLVVTACFFMVARQFTPNGGFGITEIGILIALVFIFLFVCGLIVNFVDPTTEATKLSNRWSTFMIVTFLYSIIGFIVLSVAVPLVTGFSYNVLDAFAARLIGNNWAYALLTLFVSALAVFVLYWRTRQYFHTVLESVPRFFGRVLIFCVALNWLILFVIVDLI